MCGADLPLWGAGMSGAQFEDCPRYDDVWLDPETAFSGGFHENPGTRRFSGSERAFIPAQTGIQYNIKSGWFCVYPYGTFTVRVMGTMEWYRAKTDRPIFSGRHNA